MQPDHPRPRRLRNPRGGSPFRALPPPRRSFAQQEGETAEPSEPVGVEWTNFYRLGRRHLADLDVAWTRARFRDDDPAGDRISGAVETVVAAGLARQAERGVDWSLRLRYVSGAPLESRTDSMMVWGSTGPWKRTIVYREAVDHNFPMPHPDVLEQFIDFQVPPAMFDELAMFDGSVIVERTKGEMSARCDKEAANFLALNLAHEIIEGERTVDEARQKYGEEIQAMKAGRPTPYTQRLLFEPMSDQRADDPDHAILPM